MTMTESSTQYALIFGGEVTGQVHGLFVAQAWMIQTINEMESSGQLPRWRSQALYVQVENMPRGGFSFTVDGIGVVGCSRV